MPSLIVKLSEGKQTAFPISGDRVTVGRNAKNQIVIIDSYVSGFHAEFKRLPGGGYELIDLDSYNGTLLNGQVLHKGLVNDGDQIVFGVVKALFQRAEVKAPVRSAPAPMTSGRPPQATVAIAATSAPAGSARGQQEAKAASESQKLAEADLERVRKESEAQKRELEMLRAKVEASRVELKKVVAEVEAAEVARKEVESARKEAEAARKAAEAARKETEEQRARLKEGETRFSELHRAVEELRRQERSVTEHLQLLHRQRFLATAAAAEKVPQEESVNS